MSPTGRTVPTSQGHVPTQRSAPAAGLVSGGTGVSRRTTCAGLAAAAAVILGATLLLALPDLGGAADYVAVVAGATGVASLVGGAVLWRSANAVARTVTASAALVLLLGEALQVSVGLPGVAALPLLPVVEGWLTLASALAVLGLLLADALRRRPEQAPDHPYAL